jgi:hypothetical protein
MELQAHGDCKHYERHTLSIANPALKEHPESEIVGFLVIWSERPIEDGNFVSRAASSPAPGGICGSARALVQFGCLPLPGSGITFRRFNFML